MSIFREYDIRGIFQEDLNQEVVVKIGYLLGLEASKYDNKVAIGYDARTHSPTLFEWLSSGFALANIEVYNLGLIPTPVAYFCVFNTDIKSSVMITGSHNPPQYNGFKITINKQPFYGSDIQMLAKKLLELDSKDSSPLAQNDELFHNNTSSVMLSGSETSLDSKQNLDSKIETKKLDVLKSYIDFMCKEFSFLSNLKESVAFDCGNGVAGVALDEILSRLNIKAERLYFNPDGTFPNHHPDPSEEKNLADLKNVLDSKNINIGIAYDGDADRVALLSRTHNFKGDELAILFAKDIATRKQNPLVIGEVKCSQIMYDEINKFGKAYMYKTGHSNLKVKLKELNADLACEMSGHIFFNDRYFGYDDAIYASLRILEMIYKQGNELDNAIAPLEEQILSLPKTYSTDEEKISVSEESKFAIIENLKEKLKSVDSSFPVIKNLIDIDGVRVIFENGWGLVRASNTTPVLVTRFESYSQSDLEIYKNALLGLLDI